MLLLIESVSKPFDCRWRIALKANAKVGGCSLKTYGIGHLHVGRLSTVTGDLEWEVMEVDSGFTSVPVPFSPEG